MLESKLKIYKNHPSPKNFLPGQQPLIAPLKTTLSVRGMRSEDNLAQ